MFCFIGDIFNLLNFDFSPLGALLSFLCVNLLLLRLSYGDFKSLKFDKTDRYPVLISFLFTVIICTSIFLSLQFENMAFDFSLYVNLWNRIKPFDFCVYYKLHKKTKLCLSKFGYNVFVFFDFGCFFYD